MPHRIAGAVIPKWMIQAIVTTLITVLVGGAAAWGTRVSSRGHEHETRIARIEEHQVVRDKAIDQNLEDLKKGQEEQRQDTKAILRELRRR